MYEIVVWDNGQGITHAAPVKMQLPPMVGRQLQNLPLGGA